MVKGSGQVHPDQLQTMGLYLVLTIKPGLVLMWDKKTSLYIKLAPEFQVNNHVCMSSLTAGFFTKHIG